MTKTKTEESLAAHLRELQGGRCASCWTRAAVQIARSIPDTPENEDAYGREVLDHERNCRLVCETQACVDFWSLAAKPYSRRILVSEILAEIEKAGEAHP